MTDGANTSRQFTAKPTSGSRSSSTPRKIAAAWRSRSKHLKAVTAPFASDLAARGVAAAALAPSRPAARRTRPGRDVHAWLRYYGRLMALRATAERGADRAERIHRGGRGRRSRSLLEALAGAAKPVTLSAREHETPLAVYPKSAFALLHCHASEPRRSRGSCRTPSARPERRPGGARAHRARARRGAHQHRVLAWIACTAGPGAPVPRARDADPELPERRRRARAAGLIAICKAFDAVNWARLRALEPLIAPDPEDDDAPRRRPSWSQFFASVASTRGPRVGRRAARSLARRADRDHAARRLGAAPGDGGREGEGAREQEDG
jgi:hypothetical protein